MPNMDEKTKNALRKIIQLLTAKDAMYETMAGEIGTQPINTVIEWLNKDAPRAPRGKDANPEIYG